MGQLTLNQRPARMWIHNYVQGATIPGKRVSSYVKQLRISHATFVIYIQYEKKNILFCAG
jgi:hypothetical protein